MALRTACIWQQRRLGHWIYQKIAAPQKELPVVSNDDIRTSSRAIRDVHHFQCITSNVIKLIIIFCYLLLPFCCLIIAIARRVTRKPSTKQSLTISPSDSGQSCPSSSLQQILHAWRYFTINFSISSFSFSLVHSTKNVFDFISKPPKIRIGYPPNRGIWWYGIH